MSVEQDREKLKAEVMKAAEDYCDLLDYVEKPVGLDYRVKTKEASISIDASLNEE